MLTNGMNRPVVATVEAVKREAGFNTGQTSLVQCGDLSITQHENGDWDIHRGDDCIDTYYSHEGTLAVKQFFWLIGEQS